MAKLSKVHFYAIQWLHHQGMPVSDIANELKLSAKQVINNVVQSESANETSQQPPPLTNPKNLMITQTSGKGTNTVAIMTKQASELGDELKKQHESPQTNKGIFRPRS